MSDDFAATPVATDVFDLDQLRQMLEDIVQFASGSKVETGFGYLNEEGKVELGTPVELWITCRMTHVFSLAKMLGIPGTGELAEHGIRSLASYFKDAEYGGWYAAIEQSPGEDGQAAVVNDQKQAYAHAFVLLAATSGVAADIPGADRLYVEAREDQDQHWWRDDERRVVEAWDRAFTEVEEYRGLNSNMHTTEAYIAAYDVANDRELLDRATSILNFVAHLGSSTNWRLPEHFSSRWFTQVDYNSDKPADPFRPFGATPGHGLEWSRLMLHARASLMAADGKAPEWMLPGAVSLYTRAATDGWDVDGAPGFVYTTDMAGLPVVRERMHWVLFEAINAGIVLLGTLEAGEGVPEALSSGFRTEQIRGQLGQWWAYATDSLLAAPGRWTHELDTKNQPSTRTWAGHPDAYHVAQMLLMPGIGTGPTFAAALRQQAAQ